MFKYYKFLFIPCLPACIRWIYSIVYTCKTNKQFTTNITLNGEPLKTVDDQKILGTIISSDLTWNKNTDNLVKRANCSMRLLHAASKGVDELCWQIM